MMIEIACTEGEKSFLVNAIFRNTVSDECILKKRHGEDECLRHGGCRSCIEENIRWTVREKDCDGVLFAERQIAVHYGLGPQLRQCVEEAAELIKAVTKFERHGGRDGTAGSLTEELADMGVMTRQIAYLTGTEAGVGEVTEKKVRRQEKLIREEEYQDGTL